MSESPAKRFRRIIKAWREQEGQMQGSVVSLAPAAPSRIPQDETPQSPAQRTGSTAQPHPIDARQPVRSTASVRATALSEQLAVGIEQAAPSARSSEIPALEPAPSLDKLRTPADARRFLERLREKTTQVVQDFASGEINQRQFQAVYAHYQRQRIAVEQALIEMPGSGAWRAEAVEGHTSFLRQQHAAQILSYAIYETAGGVQVTQVGEFGADATLIQETLNNFRSSPHELFGAGMTSTEIEEGRWLCCTPGRHTTVVVIFSAEPAAMQLEMIEDLHRDFEMVNKTSLSSGDLDQLALTFTDLWAFEQGPLEP